MIRSDGRSPNELRPVEIQPGFLLHAEGSALIKSGNTTVLCAATIEDGVPQFARGTGSGWITAEYGMLPRSTHSRTTRERTRTSGRTSEIQRPIGRSLRSICQLDLLGERTFIVDCDVIQADGGTRTAAITGAYVALSQAIHSLVQKRSLPTLPLRCPVAATSAGIVEGMPVLDLNYEEDAGAEVDFNVVMTEEGELVEVQGTGESHPFSRQAMDEILGLCESGIRRLFEAQKAALAEVGIETSPAAASADEPSGE
jgi:ribonuclease PH